MPDIPLSEAAERVVGEARSEAQRLGHEFIGSEHLLLGLLRSSDLAQASLDAVAVDRGALITVLEQGQRRVRVRDDAPQAEGVPLSSHARRLLDAGSAGAGPVEAQLLLAALADRRSTLTRHLADKGIEPGRVMEEVARRAGVPVPTISAAPTPRRERQPVQKTVPPPDADEDDVAPSPSLAQEPRARREKPSSQQRAPQEKPQQPERPARERPPRPERGRDRERGEARASRNERRADVPDREVAVERRAPSVGKLAPRPKPRIPWLRLALLLALPLSIAFNQLGMSPTLIFITACLGVLPLAGYMGEATEQLSSRTGPTLGGLLNATFGNAAELIIAMIALRAGLVELVKASITGSILGNLLLILGLSIVAGGISREQLKFNRTSARRERRHARLAIVSLVFPALFKYSHPEPTSRIDGAASRRGRRGRPARSPTRHRSCFRSRPIGVSWGARRTRSRGSAGAWGARC